jgi:hypothetical protein
MDLDKLKSEILNFGLDQMRNEIEKNSELN